MRAATQFVMSTGWVAICISPADNDDRVQGEEDGDERNRGVHRFGEAQQEHAAEHEKQNDGDGDCLPGQGLGHERVLQQVHGGVSGRQCDGDDP